MWMELTLHPSRVEDGRIMEYGTEPAEKAWYNLSQFFQITLGNGIAGILAHNGEGFHTTVLEEVEALRQYLTTQQNPAGGGFKTFRL